MSTVIRPYQPGDEHGMCEAHRESILKVLSPLYAPEVIALWSQKDPAKYARKASEGETYFVAEQEGRIVGLSGWKDDELSVCYVHPDVVRQGVGLMLFQAIERDYRNKTGNTYIKTSSTLYARPFYEKVGFKVIEAGTHTFRDGITTMPDWKMIKQYENE